MKKFAFAFLMIPFLLSFTACDQKSGSGKDGGHDTDSTNSGSQDQSQGTATSFEKGGLKVYALENSPKFPDASIKLTEPAMGADLSAGSNNFKYDVQGYELGVQTSDAAGKGLANSSMGQHIHMILNNDPYTAHYMPGYPMELKDGHYVLLAFLSRSYHESVKTPGAYVLQQFIAGQPGDYKEAKLSEPHMFFSRPKGDYYEDAGETKKLMLDFFLVNCNLSPDGYKVRATINGNEFTFTKWAPYIIEGLPLGTVNIKLELLDASGTLVNSPFNPVERTCNLLATKPAK